MRQLKTDNRDTEMIDALIKLFNTKTHTTMQVMDLLNNFANPTKKQAEQETIDLWSFNFD